jgi:hypothetical protein
MSLDHWEQEQPKHTEEEGHRREQSTTSSDLEEVGKHREQGTVACSMPMEEDHREEQVEQGGGHGLVPRACPMASSSGRKLEEKPCRVAGGHHGRCHGLRH